MIGKKGINIIMKWRFMCRGGSILFSKTCAVIAVLFLLLSLVSVSFAAEDLLESYTQALKSDPRFSGAQFEHDATLERLKMARAALMPKVYLEARYMQTKQDITSSDNQVYGVSSSTYPTKAGTLYLSQTLLNIATFANVDRAKAEVKGADLLLESVKQDLAVRVAKAYLGVLASRDNVEFLSAEAAAVGMHYELIRSKFTSGLSSKTDYLDAKARISEVRANKIAAENSLDDALQSLREITGQGTAEIAGFREEIPLISPDPNNIDVWSDAAIRHNPVLGVQRQTVESARLEVNRQKAGHYPYLNLEANYNRTQADGTLYGGGSDVTTANAIVALNIPIFEGGLVRARTREALNLYKAAIQEEERQKRALVKEARAAYQGVGSAIDRVKALRDAVESQKLAVEAKREGYKSGLFAFRAVLDAERDLYRARRDHAVARYDYVINCLRLKKASGMLNVSDIAIINDWLEGASAEKKLVDLPASFSPEPVKEVVVQTPVAVAEPAVVTVADAGKAKEAQADVSVTEPAPPAIDQKTSTPEIASDPQEAILAFISQWKDAWMKKDYDGFIKMYDPVFQGAKGDYKKFAQSKKKSFGLYHTIHVTVEQVEIKKTNDLWVVKFFQSFQGDTYRDQGWKTITISSTGNKGLRIVGEI